MGGSSVSSSQWKSYTKSTNVAGATSTRQVYTNNKIKDALNPRKFDFRESRDNTAQPISTPIIIGLDITGSMEHLMLGMSKGIGDFVAGVFEKDIVQGPQVCLMGVGDVLCDDSPIQITQFESDTKILDQLKEIYFEQGGGGNGEESYHVPWYYAAKHVKTDAYEKRNQKGILITIGNDGTPNGLSSRAIKEFIGKEDRDYSSKELLSLAYDKFEIYHIHMESRLFSDSTTKKQWFDLLGKERVIVINDSDVNTIADVLTALCMKLKGYSVEDIKASLNNAGAANAVAVVESTTNIAKTDLMEF